MSFFPHPVARNNNRRVLVDLFNFARSRKYIDSNPAIETATSKQVGKEVGIPQPEQVAQLLGVFPRVYPPVLCHRFIRWDQTGRTSETGLDRHQIRLVFYRHASGRICPSNWRRLFKEVRIKAGVTEWPSDRLRHSFATYWLEKHRDAPRLALEMDNSVGAMMNHYHHVLDDPEDSGRFWSITSGPR